jgi:hypothetical protein
LQNFKQFRHTLFGQLFKEHLIIALLLQLIQEIIDCSGGQEEHFNEHFLQIIFLQILQNKEQFIHIIFLHKLFPQIFAQVKHILLLHVEHVFQLLSLEHKLHFFISLNFILGALSLIHSGHIISFFLLHIEQIGL